MSGKVDFSAIGRGRRGVLGFLAMLGLLPWSTCSRAGVDLPRYPRVLGVDYKAHQYGEEAVRERLARFEVLVLGFWRGYERGRLRMLVDDLRRRNPQILIGQYALLNEVQGQAGPNEANRDMVDKLDREGWWLKNRRGDRVQWTSRYGHYEVDLTSWARPDKEGLRWPEWKVRRDVREVFTLWPRLDFVFLDNVFERPRVSALWRRDAGEEDGKSREVAAAARQGYVAYCEQLRKLMPGMRVLANVDHDLSAPEYDGIFDGAFLEELLGRPSSMETWRGWAAIMERYRTVARHVKDPRFVVFHAVGGSTDYRLMRYGLASSLMGDGLFAYNSDDGPGTPWFDEYDANLGQPLSDARAATGSTAWMREFSNGMAVVNPGPAPAVVALPRGLQRLRGRQDPAFNDGSLVRELRLLPRDGALLLKAARG
ncbi:MAG TPA: putative glycoside hydrolase [Burkholderiaceae bacterium]|nr:putative glycoside hydrolase [Burkholderiaceae bacterium]